MSKVIKLSKGLNINLKGVPERILGKTLTSDMYAVKPSDFQGLTPRLCVKQGDVVKAGTPVLTDKNIPEINVVSPVSGVVEAINRGERRKLLEITIKATPEQESEKYEIPAAPTREKTVELMLKAGYWTFLKQRPYGVLAKPADQPKAIFVSGFDTSPLALDLDFLLSGQENDFQKGLDVLAILSEGNVHLGLSKEEPLSKLANCKNAEITLFNADKHPAGNVGVQIHHIAPLNKGEIVWTMDAQHVAMLGKFFNTGVYSANKIIAICGSRVKRPQYFRVTTGVNLSAFADLIDHSGHVRYISGDVLTGVNVGKDGYLSFYSNKISVIPEGDKYEFLGWALPRLKKFSASKSYLSWLTPKKTYDLDTNTNGGERAFVVSNQYEKVLPMDIYPVYLLKAILAENIEKMEQLGIYEVIEEDLALCEFICASKIEVQSTLRKGIDLMLKEM